MYVARESKLYVVTLEDVMMAGSIDALTDSILLQLGEGWTYDSTTANDTTDTLEMTFSKRYEDPNAPVIEEPPPESEPTV